MDYKQYVEYDFHRVSAINVGTGFEGRSYPMHWHSYGEIIMVGPGETNIYQVNQNVYHLIEGDFVMIWPTEMHATIDADRTNSLVIQFSNSFANSLFDFQRIMHFYHDLHVLCIYAHPELVGKLNKLALKMRDTWQSGDRDRETRCCMMLMEFMIILDENRDILAPDISNSALGSQNQTSGTLRRLVDVTDYIKTHLADDDLSQASMAKMAGISQEHFSRIFKNLTGQNYSSWLNMIRLEKAISLLPESGMSLTEIAMLSGFQSIPTFNRVFKNSKGMSPSEYRNLFLV